MIIQSIFSLQRSVIFVFQPRMVLHINEKFKHSKQSSTRAFWAIEHSMLIYMRQIYNIFYLFYHKEHQEKYHKDPNEKSSAFPAGSARKNKDVRATPLTNYKSISNATKMSLLRSFERQQTAVGRLQTNEKWGLNNEKWITSTRAFEHSEHSSIRAFWK